MWNATSRGAVLDDMKTGGPARVADVLRRARHQAWLPYYVREMAEILALSIDVETPFYLLQPVPMAGEYRAALRNTLLACATFGVPVTMVSAGAARSAPRDEKRTIRLSFHTHGDETNWRHIKDSHAPGRFYFNQSGYSGWLELSDAQKRTVEDVAATPSLDPALLTVGRRSKYEQPGADAHLPAGGIFYPLQMLDDTVAQHQRLAPLDVLRAAAECANAARPLIIKRHPRCTNDAVSAALADLRQNSAVHIVNAPIEQLLEACAVVLTANSSVGFSALCCYKPVITFAASDYEICTRAVSTLAELTDALRQPAWSVDKARYDRFLSVFFNELTIALDDQEAWNDRVVGAIADCVNGYTALDFEAILRAVPQSTKP